MQQVARAGVTDSEQDAGEADSDSDESSTSDSGNDSPLIIKVEV